MTKTEALELVRDWAKNGSDAFDRFCEQYLPDNLYDLLCYRFAEGLQWRAIGQRLGCHLSTASNYFHREILPLIMDEWEAWNARSDH